MSNLKDFLPYLTPHSVNCTKVRFGENYDGGYVIIDHNLEDIRGILSFGVGPTCLFEKDFVRKYPRSSAYLFDHTIPAPKDLLEKMLFMQKGIGDHSNKFMQTLNEYIDQYVIPHGGRWILKMDIEGDEWNVLNQVDLPSLSMFDQLIIEFHHWRDDRDVYRKVYEKLFKNFCVVHVHANNHAPLLKDDCHQIPEVLEITYLRRTSNLFFQANKESFPTSLDFPNDPTQPDIELNFWPFKTIEKI
ncbi:hypothetical protein [Bdellovibrio sp. HCB2-146]|uniref:hypothetical protein n=1 Tax=Bdellovibrio sp. HCB2-146 TaxID=3394362 RepID=UPI0039BD8C55